MTNISTTKMFESGLFQDLRTLKAKVEYILKKYPDTTNDDALLVTKVCNEFKINVAAKASVIERIRRKFNENDLYLPTDKQVAIKRKVNMDLWSKLMGNKLF